MQEAARFKPKHAAGVPVFCAPVTFGQATVILANTVSLLYPGVCAPSEHAPQGLSAPYL